MSLAFRKAIGSEAKPLIGLYAESGCGKTKGSLLIAKGFTGDMAQVGMIETESGRGEAWADDAELGGYNVLSLREEFSPTTYGKAISVAEKAGYQCLIVDSASHEWEGIGGVLDMAAKNEDEGKKGQLVWQKPKIDHARQFMLRLTQTPIPLVIVCMRAKFPMEQVVVNGKKEWQRSKVLAPKQSDDILSEMFVHGWIDSDHRFHGTKYTMDSYRQILVDGEPLSIESGARLKRHVSKNAGKQTRSEALVATPGGPEAQTPGGQAQYIAADQAIYLEDLCKDNGIPVAKLLEAAKVERISLIPAADYERALAGIKTVIERRNKTAA